MGLFSDRGAGHEPTPMLANIPLEPVVRLVCPKCGHTMDVDAAILERGYYVCRGIDGIRLIRVGPNLHPYGFGGEDAGLCRLV